MKSALTYCKLENFWTRQEPGQNESKEAEEETRQIEQLLVSEHEAEKAPSGQIDIGKIAENVSGFSF